LGVGSGKTFQWTALLAGLLQFATESAPDRVPVTRAAQWVQTHYLALFGAGPAA
jgi:hypothetical protein